MNEKSTKKVIVYYSYTSHTKMIAEMVKESIGCDSIIIEPKNKYSDDYNEVVELAKEETKNKITPEINEIDLSSYDAVILGMPVWWYTFAPPVRTFLIKSNLENKTIIPFATNAGWLGHTFEDVKELCENSEVINEMNIVFTGDYRNSNLVTKEEDIKNWIDKIKKL